MTESQLEKIITFSVGVGMSYDEAYQALLEAKAKKGTTNGPNVVVYDGPSIDPSPSAPSNAIDYIRVLKHIQETDPTGGVLESAQRLAIDPRTGLLNKLGYEAKRLELESLGVRNGTYILLDGDNMKDANTTLGGTTVDRLIEASGRGVIGEVVNSSRVNYEKRKKTEEVSEESEKRKRKYDRRATQTQDIVAHRVNGDGGDEILIYIPSENPNIQNALGMVDRILKKMYESQTKIYK